MKKSLRLTLGIGILATGAVFTAGVIIGIHWVQTRAVALEESAQTTLDTTARGLNNVFIQAELAVRFAAADLSECPRTREEMKAFTKLFYESVAKQCPAVSHVCIGFVPGGLVSNETHNAFIYRRIDSNGKAEYVRWSDTDGKDYLVHSWYLLPSSLGHPIWTISHLSHIVDGRLVISHAAPFLCTVDGKQQFAGVAAVAIDIAALDGLLVPFRPVSFATRQARAESFVANSWGMVIMAPDLHEKVGLSLYDAAAIVPKAVDRSTLRSILRTGPPAGIATLESTAAIGPPAPTEFFYRRLINGWVAIIAVPASWRLWLIAPAAIIGSIVFLLFVGLVALAFLAERRRLAAERAAAEGELNAARAIQHDLLPAVLPPLDGFTNVTVAASLDAAKGVGGDLFDVVPVDATHVAFIIGDVSGKGVPASLFMAIVQTLQRSLLRSAGANPSVAVNALNRLLSANNRSNMFVTYWIGILNVSSGELVFTNGGHNPPLVHRVSGSVEFLRDRHGPPLGIIPSAKPYRSSSIRLAEGDVLVLYTDGVTEASDRHLNMFSDKRLEATLTSRPNETPAITLAAIKSAVAAFVNGAEPFDDLTLLIARFGDTGAERRIDLPADAINAPELNEFLSSLPAVRELDDRRRNRLSVAVEELFVNVCKYAYGGKPGPFSLSVSVQNKRLALVFSDSGIAFDPLAHTDPDLSIPATERVPGGLGIFLVRKAADELSYRREADKNILTLVIQLTGNVTSDT